MVTFMKIRTLLAVVLVGLGYALSASGDVITKAYEVALDEFRAPATANGSVSFKACSNCQMQLVRVTENTRYTINDEAVRLDDFRKAISHTRDRASKTVIVMHHLESDTVVLINVSL